MLQEENREKEHRFQGHGFKKRQFHMMGPLQGDYYDDLSDTGSLERLPPVLTKLHNESSNRFLEDLNNYREDRYKILDEENFVQLDTSAAWK